MHAATLMNVREGTSAAHEDSAYPTQVFSASATTIVMPGSFAAATQASASLISGWIAQLTMNAPMALPVMLLASALSIYLISVTALRKTVFLASRAVPLVSACLVA
jgi:hypothetical protein